MSLPLYHLTPDKQNGKVRLTAEGVVPAKEEALFRLGTREGNAFCVPAEGAWQWLKTLGSTGRLYYEKRKLIVDPFTPFTFVFELDPLPEGELRVRGVWQVGKHRGYADETPTFFAVRTPWLIVDGIARVAQEEVPLKWVRQMASGPIVLPKREAAEFVREWEGEPCVVWKKAPTTISTEPMPRLHLSDRQGAFANLFFDYGAFGQVVAHELPIANFRRLSSEAAWEKDLLETDFQKKIVDQSHYFCPLDKVAKSLTFLLEIGWAIFDAQGRTVHRKSAQEVDVEEQKHRLIVRAAFTYGAHTVDVQQVMGAFNRREQFLSLAPDAVGLFDRDQFAEQFGELSQEEMLSSGVAVSKASVGLLATLTTEIAPSLKEKLERWRGGLPSVAAVPSSGFQATLFSYQTEGLQWLKFLEEGEWGGLLADEMGLGKTVQVLAFFSQFAAPGPSLIVVPTSLLFHWKKEFEKFLPTVPVYLHVGPSRPKAVEALPQEGILLTSYALLRHDADLLAALSYACVVLDEGQTIKNPDSQIARVCFHLNSPIRFIISGTPVENRWEDLWSLFHFLQPGLLGERAVFQKQMMAAESDSRFLTHVKKKIRPFLLRRRKNEVALQLPPKWEQTVYVEMGEEERGRYEAWLQRTRSGLLQKISLEGAKAHRMQILEAILRLRQFCAHPWLIEEPTEDVCAASAKYQRLLADVAEVVAEGSKVLIYSQFTQGLKLIERGLKEQGYAYVYLDGSTKDRASIVQQFQEDARIPIFLISLKAGGVGLNLTAADYVFLYDPWWNEAVESQAIDRAHRVGKTTPVIARRYIAALTIEEKIMHLKTRKRALAESLLDGDTAGGDAAVQIEELLALLD